jgi:hypothetical protein
VHKSRALGVRDRGDGASDGGAALAQQPGVDLVDGSAQRRAVRGVERHRARRQRGRGAAFALLAEIEHLGDPERPQLLGAGVGERVQRGGAQQPGGFPEGARVQHSVDLDLHDPLRFLRSAESGTWLQRERAR